MCLMFLVVFCFPSFSEYVGLINTNQGCHVEPAITKCDKTLIDLVAAATVHLKKTLKHTQLTNQRAIRNGVWLLEMVKEVLSSVAASGSHEYDDLKI